MTRSSFIQALVATLVCLIPIGWLGISSELALRNGQVFLIETRGFDPRDLLRGDFVWYRFPALQRTGQGASRDLVWGETAYVVLVPDDQGILRQSSLTNQRPELSAIYVAGTVRADRLQVPAEKYFVTEGTGKALEQLDRPYARVSISRDGRMNMLEIVPRERVESDN